MQNLNTSKPSQSSSQVSTSSSIPIIPFASSLLLAVVLCIAINYFYFTPKIAYVNTGKLLIGFAEANKIERDIKAEDEKWQAQYKQLADSIQATMDNMSKEYNSANTAKKKEMQDMLSARNQQANNFRQANIRKMDELRQKKMQSVYEKINVFLGEYGKKHGYSIILGTVAGGSIVYGDERKYEITDNIIKGLNERYK